MCSSTPKNALEPSMPPDAFSRGGLSAKQPAIIADVHLHTHYSHGQADPLAMLQAAKRQGLSFIGFSEHSPRPAGYTYPEDYQEKLTSLLPQYVREVRAFAAQEAANGITVLLGLEVDYIPGQEAYATALCREHPYDYIIGGLHFQQNWGFDFSAADWERLDEDARFIIYRRYYEDLRDMCATGLFHIAAHPDLIKIFSIDSFKAWLDTPQAKDCVHAALSAMKKHGVIMEISSAGLRKACREIYPGPVIMAMAADLGLAVSFASDAHCTGTPAYAFDDLARYAGRYGYSHSVIVEKGKARQVPFTMPDIFS